MFMKIVRPEDHPDLFFIQGMTVEDFYEKYDTPEKALEASIKAGVDAERALSAVLEYTIPSWKIVVLEGDVITPAFAARMREVSEYHFSYLFPVRRRQRAHQRESSKRRLMGSHRPLFGCDKTKRSCIRNGIQ